MISRDCKTTTHQQSYWQGISSRSMLLATTAYLLTSLPAIEATGWWKQDVRSAGHPLLFSSPGGAVDDDIDAVLRKIEEEQLWGEVERVGFETLEVEVAEKKRGKIITGVAKACSVGTQITAIMCGGGLLFRLLPVLLGCDVEDQEDVEAESALLLQSGDDSRLPGLPLNRRPFFLTNGGVTDGPEVAAAVAARKPNGEGGAIVSGSRGELVEVAAADGEVVAFTERRATLKRVRRLSRPFLRVMASSFTMLLMARLFLGDLLAARINPEVELLFSDDVMNTYAEKVDIPEEADEAIPFPQDSEEVPGRRKMKGRSIQRLPRPPGESETERAG